MLISAGIRFIFWICHVGSFEELCHIPVDQARRATGSDLASHKFEKWASWASLHLPLPLKARRPVQGDRQPRSAGLERSGSAGGVTSIVLGLMRIT